MRNICTVTGCELFVKARRSCNRHYLQMTRRGRIVQDTFIEDLYGELWKDIDEHPGYEISNMGRVKSTRNARKKLLQAYTAMRLGKSPRKLTRLGVGPQFALSHLVAQAFCLNKFDDSRVIFLNGDTLDCRSINISWIGTHYYGIAEKNLLVESKKSELAGNCLKYMQGDSEALNNFFDRKTKDLRSLAYRKNEAMIGTWKKTSVDIYSVVNEALMIIFRAIRRGLLRTAKKIDAWCWVITRNLLCNVVNSGLWEVSMTQKNRGGEEYNLIDLAYQGHS